MSVYKPIRTVIVISTGQSVEHIFIPEMPSVDGRRGRRCTLALTNIPAVFRLIVRVLKSKSW